MNVKLLLKWLFVLMFGISNAQEITLDTSLVSDEADTIEEFWYWSGGFPVLGTGFTPNSTVTVYDTDSNGKRWRDFTGTVDSQGKFSVQISAKMIQSLKGLHTVKATDGQGKSANATLQVIANKNDVIPVTANVKYLTMSQFFDFGIKLHAGNIEPNSQVVVHIFSPNESGSGISGQYFADANGEFNITFNGNTPTYPWGDTMPDIAGTWRVNVEQFETNYYGMTEFRIIPDNPSSQSYDPIGKVDNGIPSTPITRFEVNGTGYNTDPDSSVFYEDMTDKVFNLQAGQTYNVKIKGKNRVDYAPDTYTLFIDWNQNGILDESNEMISEGYVFGSTGVDDKFTQFPLTIPQNAVNGNTRIRVLKMESASQYSMFWPIGASGYYYNSGQAEDYTFNISGGIADPGCDFTCPSDINVNTLPGEDTVKVNYDLPFNCGTNGSSSCIIDYPGNNFENWMPVSNFDVVANDFVVPAGKTLKIDKVSPHLVRFSYGATVSFYKDNNGKPGELITSFETPAIESQNVIGDTSDGTAYETVIKLPQVLELTSGKYWVALNMQGPLISWETKSSLSNGTTAFTTANGQDWTAKEGFDSVFKIGYVCETAQPQVILVQGLDSGSDFPEGNNVVMHNLVYEGVVIDTCIFNIEVKKILATGEVSQQQILYYPNPVKDMLNLSYTKEIQSVEIFDLSGKQVLRRDLKSKYAAIDLSKLPSGSYILNAKISGEIKSIKILKK